MKEAEFNEQAPQLEKNKKYEISDEERKFAINICDTVSRWLYEPINIRKYGPGYGAWPNKTAMAIEQWYNIWCQHKFSTSEKDEYINSLLAGDEEIIIRWFKECKLFSLDKSLLTEADINAIEEQIPKYSDHYKYGGKIGQDKIEEKLNEIKQRQFQEFERLKRDMPKFNLIAAKMHQEQTSKEAKELGLSFKDYLFMLEMEGLCRGLPETEEGRTIFYELWKRWTDYDITTTGSLDWHEKALKKIKDLQLDLYGDEELEQLLREKTNNLKGGNIIIQRIEEIKINRDRYRNLRKSIGDKLLSVSYAEQLRLPEKYLEYPK